MSRITTKLPSWDGVAAGQTATLKLPIGRRYHELMIPYSGATLAQITEIRVRANAKIIHRYSATDRDTMNKFDRRTAAGGLLIIPFDRRGLLQRDAEEETALNTGSKGKDGSEIVNLTVEADIDAAAVTPALATPRAITSDRLPGGPGTVMMVDRQTRNASGAGEYQLGDISFGTPDRLALNRTFFKLSANDINSIRVSRGNYDIFDRTKAQNERFQTDGVRTPQASWHVYDPSEGGYGGELVQLAGYADFRYILDMSGTASLTVYSEFIGQLDG